LDHDPLDVLQFCVQVGQVAPPTAVSVSFLCLLNVGVELDKRVGSGGRVDFVAELAVKLAGNVL
jgi:hypothetical protein